MVTKGSGVKSKHFKCSCCYCNKECKFLMPAKGLCPRNEGAGLDQRLGTDADKDPWAGCADLHQRQGQRECRPVPLMSCSLRKTLLTN